MKSCKNEILDPSTSALTQNFHLNYFSFALKCNTVSDLLPLKNFEDIYLIYLLEL